MTSPEIVRQIRARNYWPPGPNNALVRVALASPKNAIVVVVGAADGGGLEHLHAAGLRVRPFDIMADPDDPEASVAFWRGEGPLDGAAPATADFAGGAACTRSPITAVNMATSAADALRPGGVLCFTCNTNDRNCMRGMDALAKFLRVQVLAGAFTLLKEWVEADPDDPDGSKKKVRVVRAVRTGAPLASFAAAAHSKSWSRPIYAEGHAQPLFFAHNDYRQVWTGDREILTLDPLFGSFTGSGLIAVSNLTKAKDVSRTIDTRDVWLLSRRTDERPQAVVCRVGRGRSR